MADNTIQMIERRFNFFPKTFRIGGDTHTVKHVERCWTQPGRTPRLYFRVHTTAGNMVLYQDVNANTWHREA